jgi:hypothetical protein
VSDQIEKLSDFERVYYRLVLGDEAEPDGLDGLDDQALVERFRDKARELRDMAPDPSVERSWWTCFLERVDRYFGTGAGAGLGNR